jgi:hypothetical protein
MATAAVLLPLELAAMRDRGACTLTSSVAAARQVLWDVASGEPICGTPTGNSFTFAMKFFNHASDK